MDKQPIELSAKQLHPLALAVRELERRSQRRAAGARARHESDELAWAVDSLRVVAHCLSLRGLDEVACASWLSPPRRCPVSPSRARAISGSVGRSDAVGSLTAEEPEGTA